MIRINILEVLKLKDTHETYLLIKHMYCKKPYYFKLDSNLLDYICDYEKISYSDLCTIINTMMVTLNYYDLKCDYMIDKPSSNLFDVANSNDLVDIYDERVDLNELYSL